MHDLKNTVVEMLIKVLSVTRNDSGQGDLNGKQDLGIWNHLGVVVNWLLGACKMHLGKLLGACKLDLGKHLGKLLGTCKLDLGKLLGACKLHL
jgi:hypothetical protein